MPNKYFAGIKKLGEIKIKEKPKRICRVCGKEFISTSFKGKCIEHR